MRDWARHIALLLLLSISSISYGQTYGNEWINYNQTYYAFEVYPTSNPTSFYDGSGMQTGIHILDYTTLANSGVPLTAFSSENIQIFGKEREVALHIVDGGDSSIDPGDYILFFTERNDGWLDSTLYEDPTGIGNPYYSLYNDTLQYFFTWNSSTNNLRYVVEDNSDFALYTPAPYVLFDRWSTNVPQYQEGLRLSYSSSSFFTYGEGWSSSKVDGEEGTPGYVWNAAAMQLPNIYQGAGAPDVIFHGMHQGISDPINGSNPDHRVRYTIGNSNYEIVDTLWSGYRGVSLNAVIPNAEIPFNAPSNYLIEIVPLGLPTDYQSISHWRFRFPRIPSFGGESYVEFKVENSSTASKVRLDLGNLNFSNPFLLAHGDVPKILTLTPNGGSYTTVVTNSASGFVQDLVYQDSSTFRSVDTLIPVNADGFTPGRFTDFGNMNLEEALLMIYHPKLQPASNQYIAYRQGPGGGYNAIGANVLELYQQFGGGIEKHICGIRRFAHFVYNQSTAKPVGLFMMGKGIREATIGNDQGTRRNTSYSAESLIPSFGQPPSDASITSGLEGIYDWAPLIATGRISARTNTELEDYLNKVIEFENAQDPTSIYNTPEKDWQKQIIHFAGGSDQNQQDDFQDYMTGMANTIEDSLFGGNVLPVYKDDSDPLNPAILQSVTDRISEGVSLMSYFGHASATNSGFEINLDEPTNWDNAGKYPVMLVNSCYNGNVFQFNNSKSEDFVQVPNAGAIAYIASTNIGYAGQLNWYSQSLYRHFSYKSYGNTIGAQMKANVEDLEPFAPNKLYYETTCTQMGLNGDPMIRINPHERPEIELLAENVFFTPENLDLTMDSITIHIDLKNLGRSVVDTFRLEIIRDFPGSAVDSVYTFNLPNLHYVREFEFKMPMQSNIGLGLNTFSISVDIPTFIDEQYDEIGNNQIIKTLFIDIDGIIPVLPYKFAVVPNSDVTVKASTNNPIAPFNTYRFEIDTIDFVGAPSPAHRFALVSGLGGVKQVTPSQWTLTGSPSADGTLVCEDSVVYFWRVSIDGDSIWRESSFQYINGREGWGQDHFFQFKDNSFSGLEYDRPTRTKNFAPDDKTLECHVKNSPSQIDYNAYYINDNQQDYGACSFTPSIHVAIIDPITHEPWGTSWNGQNPGNDFGNANNGNLCRQAVEKQFIFRQNTFADLNAFQNLVNNIVPDSHYILIYTPMLASYSGWDIIFPGGEMYTTFAGLGSDSIIPGRPNLPFAFFCQKGDLNSVVEICSQDASDDIILQAILEGFDNIGVESAPLIGPSSDWGNVYWKQDPQEAVTSDSTMLTINAYDANQNFQFSIDTLFTLNDSIQDLNSLVDASLYPFISLKAYYTDTLNFTPAQMDRWHVLFSPLPEAAIDGSTAYTWSAPANNTVMEGETIEFAVDVINIFTVDMDSLLISYWIEDQNHVLHPLDYPRQDSLKVGDTLRDTITIPTTDYVGVNSLWMEVNPYINGSVVVTDQPEQEHFNNIIQIPFFVREDTINPILDVTFNGNHILNGDIIDPNSEILITLKDENDYLIMDDISDTTKFGVYLTDPLGNVKRIPFMSVSQGITVMQWIPATAQNKRFKIVWPAEFEIDGEYTLLVQGSDRSDNISGDFEYRVNFEIVHESTITNMMNYPNPFSTSTRFVFTLTGTEAPDDIIIQIMTVSGRVVREITEDQIGLIQIGRNITEYAWDGTDEFGDPLANGVYLYRVKAKINGEDIKHRESGADPYFEKSFGKMYILR